MNYLNLPVSKLRNNETLRIFGTKGFVESTDGGTRTRLYAAANAALAAGNNLVFHEDFEPASTQSPPPGWAMWGAAQHKVPANYTRDTTNPHSGRACFRIHHPAKTGGYVVLAPDRALRPKSGMIYTASFWARTDQAGKAMFSWTA